MTETEISATPSSAAPSPHRGRRWLRFSLRTLLLAMLVAGAALGWHMRRVRQQQESVAAVTRLGGWVYYDYEVDARCSFDPQAQSWAPAWLLSALGRDFFHPVAMVNMVYNDDGPKRLENDQKGDEVLHNLGGFPRLKFLLLQHGQASDSGLRYVGQLENLERLYIWDGEQITDAGTAHLAGLQRLEYLHLSKSQIGDDSLAVFARMPKLNHLSLQENTFTDAGLAHLANMTQLESLWVGLGQTRITDQGLVHLKNLRNLKELDVQGCPVTIAGLRQLKHLKSLTSIMSRNNNVSSVNDL